MEACRVHQLLEGRVAFARQEGGLRIYNVLPQEDQRGAEAGYRVMRIGSPNDRPTRCVLLLGETGAGKTTFVNAALNCLFGVKFDDPFRLQVKDETEEGRRATESQTDAVTVYVIHHQPGMRHEYNCVLIDTPGLADTRGTQRQETIRSGLEAFLTAEDAGVDELHCVGIVAKANVNRDVYYHRLMIEEIMCLVGDSVPDVTCLLATFTSYADEPLVGAVIKNAGVHVTHLFPYDNGALFSQPVNADTSDYAEFFPKRWDRMRKQHDAFFGYLATAPSVSTAVLRERKLFDINKKKLRTQIKEAATLMAAYYRDKDVYSKYELQEAKNRDYIKQVKKVVISLEDPSQGLCAHNCRKCRKTCHQCSDSVEEQAVLAALCDVEVVAARVTHGLTLAEPATVTASVAVLVFTAAAAPGAETASKTAAASGVVIVSGAAAASGAETALKAAAAPGAEAVSKAAAAPGAETVSKAAAASGAETASEAAAASGAERALKAAAAPGAEAVSKAAAAPGAETASEAAAASGAERALKAAAAPGAEAVSKAAAAPGAVIVSGAGAVTGAVLGALQAAAGAASTVTTSFSIPGTGAVLSVISETAVTASPVAIAGGAALGAAGALGVAGAGYLAYKKFQEDPHACDMDATIGCTREDCRHSSSDHIRQDKAIKNETKYENVTSEEKKERYDEAVVGKREANERITRGKQDILSKMTAISQTTVELLYHGKRTQELTSQKLDYVTEVMSLHSGQDVKPLAAQLAGVVSQAMQRLTSCTAQQARGSNTLIEEMCLRMLGDQ